MFRGSTGERRQAAGEAVGWGGGGLERVRPARPQRRPQGPRIGGEDSRAMGDPERAQAGRRGGRPQGRRASLGGGNTAPNPQFPRSSPGQGRSACLGFWGIRELGCWPPRRGDLSTGNRCVCLERLCRNSKDAFRDLARCIGLGRGGPARGRRHLCGQAP